MPRISFWSAADRCRVGGFAGGPGALLCGEIGLAEAVYHIISLVFEVPSGMAADLLGRRRTYPWRASALAQDVTILLANDLPMVCLAMGLGALSGSMYSGTSSALVYDSLVQTHCTERYLSVSARLDQQPGGRRVGRSDQRHASRCWAIRACISS